MSIMGISGVKITKQGKQYTYTVTHGQLNPSAITRDPANSKRVFLPFRYFFFCNFTHDNWKSSIHFLKQFNY